MSEHSVRVIEIAQVLPHDNADALEIIPIGLWQAVVAKGSFKVGDKGIYIEPDYMVPTHRPEFAFLDRKGTGKAHRLKAIKLRGILSFGLLIPLPEDLKDAQVGDDVMEKLGIVRYEPPVRFMARPGDLVSGPPIHTQKFDLESYQKFSHVIEPGEYIYATEKLHGANARYTMWEGELYVGSRNQWLKVPDEDARKSNWWWHGYWNTPGLGEYMMANPGHVIYGEVFGDVQELKYGAKPGEVRFSAFAMLDGMSGKWFDYNDLRTRMLAANVPLVPLIHEGPFHPSILELAEQDSVASPVRQMMEGLVLVPQKERTHRGVGRVALKHISKRYWLL